MTEDDVDVLDCGEIVDERYEVIGRIGHGGMAQVYKVSDMQTGEDLALKICTKSEDADRFGREIRAMRDIDCPHVMPIVSNGVCRGLPFLLMPLAQKCLQDVRFDCQEGGDIGEALGAFLQICEGVISLHQKNWVHRDIKPRNILQVDGVWVIADFGLSKSAKRIDPTLTKTGAVIGTEIYMAPEQRSGDTKAINKTTDVYQLGLVFYQMLTGNFPYVVNASDLPSEEASIVMKCIKFRQSDRYAHVAALIEDVRALLERYEGTPSGIDLDDNGILDPISWLDSQRFAATCRRNYKDAYSQVRMSPRWELVVDGVEAYWAILFSRFDSAFVEGEIPDGCTAGAGPNGLVMGADSKSLVQFQAVEKDVIRWLAFRRVVLAAVYKYPRFAERDIDALLVLFLNYVAPGERTAEFMAMRGWRQHVVRFRPWLTKIGLKPSDLALGAGNVPNVGSYEHVWLASFMPDESQPTWWECE